MTKILEPILTAFLLWIVAAFLIPFSYFYDLGELTIEDQYGPSDLHLKYDGGAVKNFIGSYQVIARETYTKGVACDAQSGPFGYQVDADRPDPLTLSWWGPGDLRCAMLPVGQYRVETCWTIEKVLLLPIRKTRCIKSNVFEVLAAS